jgi:hypothetical protein
MGQEHRNDLAFGALHLTIGTRNSKLLHMVSKLVEMPRTNMSVSASQRYW